jgi:hypothetical protein
VKRGGWGASEGGSRRARDVGDVNAARDAYVAGRDLTVNNSYNLTSAGLTVGFRDLQEQLADHDN